ncbi:MAG: hypothetical protein QM642_07090 [Edaphocola sp.]
MFLHNTLYWHQNNVSANGAAAYVLQGNNPSDWLDSQYGKMAVAYPKFHKMDLASKLALLAAEWVVPTRVAENKMDIATVITTNHGSLEVDKRYNDTRKHVPSPALFVYTLPNIMLGELCIRHGFKGEQLCNIATAPDADWLYFYVADLLQHRGTQACLCGFVDATDDTLLAHLMWVSKIPSNLPFTRTRVHTILKSK